MKTLILLIIVSGFSISVAAQKNLFEELTEKYAARDGFSASRISGDMFDLYLKKRSIEENSPVYEALKNLNYILVVSQNSFFPRTSEAEDENENIAGIIHQNMLDYYNSNDFMLFKTERQMGEDVKVFLKKKKDVIESLALVTHSPTSTHLVELQGKIDLSSVSQLNHALNLRGLEQLYKINSQSSRSYFMNAPNAPFSEERIREMAEKHRELAEKQRHLSADQRERIEKQARESAERYMQMAEKQREMAERYRRRPIFLGFPGDTSVVYFINGEKVDAEALKRILPDEIESIEVKKSDKENEKSTIRIKTKK
jgi:hypothetical protein